MFENFGEKMANLGNAAKEKTTSFTGKIALNSKIDTAKKDIKQTYTDLGEKFFLQNQGGEIPAGYETYFNKINELNKTIEDAKQEIMELDGLKKCPNCGAEVKKDNLFCTNCGARFEEEKNEEEPSDPSKLICKNCSKEIPADSAFCPNCGTKVEKEEAPAPEAEAPKEDVCPQCGNKVKPDAAFCTQCGKALK